MKVQFSARADQDFTEALEWFRENAAPLLQQFPAAVEQAAAQIARLPRSGSPRFADATGVDTLRVVSLGRLPWLLFYVDQGEALLVVRILHQRRDLLAHFFDD